MGFKTTFDNTRGVVTEPVSGDSTIVFNSVKMGKQMFAVTVVAAGANATVSNPVTLFRPAAAGVTASLPVVNSSNIGTKYSILKNAGTSPVLVSGTTSITDGGAWTVVISTAGQTYDVMALSGTNGFYWHVV